MKAKSFSISNADFELVPCPLCGGSDFLNISESDRYDHGIVTAGCNECGFVMTNPQPTEKSLLQFYKYSYRYYYQQQDKPDANYIEKYGKKRRAQDVANFLLRQEIFCNKSSILDIGASEGSILRAVKACEPSVFCTAIEPNINFRNFAMDYVPCIESFEALELIPPEKKYDLVVVSHVLEHVKSPIVFLKKISQHLNVGGHVYLDVPSLSDYKGLDDLHIAHLYHFSITTLRRVAEKAGYEIKCLERYEPNRHPKSIRAIIYFVGFITKKESDTYDWSEDWSRISAAHQESFGYTSRLLRLFRGVRRWTRMWS